MTEIIPNWHPIFVHFTVALLSLAVGFHVVCHFLSDGTIKQQFTILARWNLWIGTGFAIITAIAGWLAYNSVAHDTSSHAAMTDHRNWALVTLGLFIVLAGWSLWCESKQQQQGKLFLIGLLIGGVLLTSTAWHGAEGVYRYGLGVMSLPQAEGEGHAHNHEVVEHQAEIQDKNILKQSGNKNVDHATENRDNHNHQH